jgi:hypothetical protein
MRVNVAAMTAGAGLLISMCSTTVRADPVTLSVSSGTSFQQTANSPCVIGDPSCQNPSSFAFTLLAPNDSTDTVSSPTYTVDQIRSLVGGNTFFVGLDLNQAMGQDSGDYVLKSFTLAVNGQTSFSTAAPVTLTPMNPGNGFSDFTITGFNLAGLPGNASLVFTTTFSGATAGRDQYFLSSLAGGSNDSSSPTPEPTTWLLLATDAAVVLRRARTIASGQGAK